MIQKKEKEVPMDTSTFKKETWMSQKKSPRNWTEGKHLLYSNI